MNDVHDPLDPNSPAYDMHLGSPETMEMLEPVLIIAADKADLPDNPDDLPGDASEDMKWAAADACSDPERDERVDDAREGGYL